MSEHHPSPQEDMSRFEREIDPAEVMQIFDMADTMGQLIEPRATAEPGIQFWYATDVPLESMVLVTEQNQVLRANRFEARLHEQDSRTRVWELRFLDDASKQHERHVRCLSVAYANDTYDLFMLPEGSDAAARSFGRQPDGIRVAWMCEQLDYDLYGIVRMLTDPITPDEQDPDKAMEREMILKELAENKVTIPGIIANGRLVNGQAS